MIRSFVALAFNGFREASRNRVTLVVAIFALGLLLASSLVIEVTVATFQRVLTDVGLGAMALMLTLLTLFLSSGMLPREVERRTLFLIVTKPISRAQFLVARLGGNMLTVGVLLLAMGAVYVLESAIYGKPITGPELIALGMLWVELLTLASIGFLMASFSGQMTSAFVTTSLYFAGHMARDIYNLAGRSKSELLQALGKVIYYLLPNLERLNYRSYATYNIQPPAAEVLSSVAYGVAYSAVAISLAVLIFNRRDFR